MAGDITAFAQAAIARGFSRDINFRVLAIDIRGMQVGLGDALMFAKAASFPTREIEDKVVDHLGHEFHFGGRTEYPDAQGYQIEFYCDTACNLRVALDQASRTQWGRGSGSTGTIGNGYISLGVLDKQLNVLRTITLQGAQIRNVGSIEYKIGEGTGEVMSFSATFAYQWYTLVDAGENLVGVEGQRRVSRAIGVDEDKQ